MSFFFCTFAPDFDFIYKMKRFLSFFAFAAIMFAFAACGGNEPESDIVTNPHSDHGEMPFSFTVGDNTKVHFSQGNLQYNASRNIWKFATHQWDALGRDANKQIGKEDYTGWIDLFGWSTAKNPTESREAYFYYPTPFEDWGVYNKIANGGNSFHQWRTLSHEEWEYLFVTRQDAAKKFGLGTVNNVEGIIILPDDWWGTSITVSEFWPSAENGMPFDGLSRYKDETPLSDHYKDNTYTAEEWDYMEARGAIFLPKTGYRLGRSVTEGGGYWSSSIYPTLSSTKAYYLDFYCRELSLRSSIFADNGLAVRLVR